MGSFDHFEQSLIAQHFHGWSHYYLGGYYNILWARRWNEARARRKLPQKLWQPDALVRALLQAARVQKCCWRREAVWRWWSCRKEGRRSEERSGTEEGGCGKEGGGPQERGQGQERYRRQSCRS